jgi:hypothetical protein
MLSQPKSEVHQQTAKLFQQLWRHSKEIMTSILPLKMPTDHWNKSIPEVSINILRHYHYKANLCWHLPEEIFINQ